MTTTLAPANGHADVTTLARVAPATGTVTDRPTNTPDKPVENRHWWSRRGQSDPAGDNPKTAVAPVSDTPRTAALDQVDLKRWYPALIAFVGGVVAVTFALSYHGLFEFAANIAHLPTYLAIIVPVGVDVFSLCCLAATFLTRDAPWRVRAYSWLMFGFTVAVSIGGNAAYAVSDIERRAGVAADQIRWGYLQVGAVIGAALWPAFSAGALHLLIIVRRHLEAQRDKIKLLSQQAEEAAVQAEADAVTEELLQARCIALAADGKTVSDMINTLSLDPEDVALRRRIERSTKPIRDALNTPKPAPTPKAATRRANT